LNLPNGKRWEWLRRELTANGLLASDRLNLRLSVVVEEGALFFYLFRPLPSPRGRNWYAFASVEAHKYQAEVVEGSVPDSEPGISAAARDG
jgi:hypothetical protein